MTLSETKAELNKERTKMKRRASQQTGKRKLLTQRQLNKLDTLLIKIWQEEIRQEGIETERLLKEYAS